MKVTAFLPVQLEIKGDNILEEVHEQLNLIEKIVGVSELESNPKFLVDCVFESEVVQNDEDEE
jgi:hypothetical protein